VTSSRRTSPRQSPKKSHIPSVTKLPSHLASARYFFFGGKGGVGKTTAASATALFLLQHANPQEKILLFSTDPAHSLSDSLTKKIGNRLVEVDRNGTAGLFAFEMDSRIALEEFRQKHGKVLAEIAERGTLLDESDIKELLNLSLPGLDEVMALFELSEFDRSAAYSHIVIDTAPSGHTTRLLRLPEVFARMVTALDRMADKHRYMVAHFARRHPALDDVDLFLRDLNERIERVRAFLYNSRETGFAVVSIPEAMSVRETERYVGSLRKEGVPVTDLIINRVEEEHDDCSFCRARVRTQSPWLKELSGLFKDLPQHRVPLLSTEVRGVEALRLIGQQIWKPTSASQKRAGRRSQPQRAGTFDMERHGEFVFAKRRIWIFGGKGGVGKTTAAAATALSLARVDHTKRVLVFSTDPAHSLSDSFNEQIGPLKKRVTGLRNLDAMEIDPGSWFEDLKKRYRSWTDELFASIGAGSKLEIKFDREAMRELVELTPPGIDEIAALGVISDLIDQDQYHSIVLDTAPTGHLIRFLELPQVALAWVRTFIKLLLKYQHIVHATHIAEELVSLSKRIKRVLALLTDSRLCEFVGVAISERMSLEETVDLAQSLDTLGMPMQTLVVNAIVPESAAHACAFCRSRRESQLLVLRSFRQKLGKSVEIFLARQHDTEIRGSDLLLQHFNGWHRMMASKSEDRRVGLRNRHIAVKNVTKAKQNNERKRTDKVAAK